MKIESIAISRKKGTRKVPVIKARIEAAHGIAGDAHAGPWHRQISFLATESIDKAKQQGLDVTFGSYAENIATSGIDWPAVPVGTRLNLGDTVIIEITQIGKTCHHKCAIYYQAGDCIMPTQGVFGKVITGGDIRQGDDIRFIGAEKD
ncbi:MAG: MOSC domain-containing protein [Deltaproteobacteria bacterium]|nr:MAG: MOSC domain-containing protein [Deltaproteobacteria bacterium]